jgi:hypothetical protein
MLDKTQRPPEWQTRKNFWEVVRVYMRDRVGDPDCDFEAYAVALADGHSHEEILDATVSMTLSAVGKGGALSGYPRAGEVSHKPAGRVAGAALIRPEKGAYAGHAERSVLSYN